MRRVASRNVTSQNGLHDPIGHRQQTQAPVIHRLVPRRIHLKQMQHLVGPKRKNHDRDKSEGERGHASPQAPGRRSRCSRRNCHLFPPAIVDASNSASRSYPAATPDSIGDFKTASRASRDWYSTVCVSVVFPPCSVRTTVPTATPGYHASSNFSVETIRSGGTISRKTPPIPISCPLT